MKIFVKAKVSAKQERVEKIDDAHFIVAVKDAPEKGRANEAIAKALRAYFHKPVKLVSGFTSRQKVFIIVERSNGLQS